MHPVYSIGHSIRSVEELITMLNESRIELLADVRRYPASRRNPQFSRPVLAASLAAASMHYVWIEALGGRRSPRMDSRNTAWRNASFRGYADYMETEAFENAIGQLFDLASRERTAMMCAEQAWQQCHRGLIADFLTARGIEVFHIGWNGSIEQHPLTAAARIVDGQLSYRAEAGPDQAGFEF
jgi:uncharacterized protein (DUF488 family)